MKNFYEYLKENYKKIYEKFGDEDTNLFYISGYDKYRYLKQKEEDKPGKMMVAFEKIKLDFKKDNYSPVNVFDILRSYKPDTNKKELWSKEYKVDYVRFLFYKIKDMLYIFAFDGDILHRKMVDYLETNKTKHNLPNIKYLSLYDTHYNDEEYLNVNYIIKDIDWCLTLVTPLPWRDLYLMNKLQYAIFLDQDVEKYFGVTKDEFISKTDVI